MKALKTLLAATFALGSLSLVSACGTLVGAGVGAAAGCALDDEDCERGAAVGGVTGAVAGTIIDPP
jgi:osmotically inducible lipoprotein OsmB